jgi:hypothetical protein
MALEDKSPMLIRRRLLFRDEDHVQRFEVRPYERVVALCRGHKPSVMPNSPDLDYGRGVSMQRISDDATDFPAALLVVDAMYLKAFAGWEVEDTDQMIDDIIEHGDRAMRSH